MSDTVTYTLLMRAKKNIGDFLIFDKAHKLLSFYKKSEEHVVHNAWEPLDDYIDDINDTKAVIICGGPGIKKNFYPGIYPLTKNIDEIKVPIILFGTGWSGLPGTDNDIKNYRFSNSSLNTLKKISSSFNFISCRDNNTVKILSNNGFANAIMTGGPAWYDLRHISKPFIIPKTIEKIRQSSLRQYKDKPNFTMTGRKHTEETKKLQREKSKGNTRRAKKWKFLLNGDEKIIKNLVKWCKENNYSYQKARWRIRNNTDFSLPTILGRRKKK